MAGASYGNAASRSIAHRMAEIAAAMSSRMTRTSWNWERNRRQAGTGGLAASSFGPNRSSRARASSSVRPRRSSDARAPTTSSTGRRYAILGSEGAGMSSESGSSLSLHSILSPVDFSEQSRQALRWAAAFAARFRSGLTVVSVVDPLLAEVARIRWHQDLVRAGTEPALREFVAATWPDGPGLSQQMVFTTPVGDPAATILGTATTAGADLIVMGTRGLGGLQKWLLGSTTERVLRRTRVPVLAVPLANESHAAPEAGMVSRILAATDFSESSVVAAKTAAQLARVFAATLTLSHIVEPVTVPTQWQ